MLKKKLMISFLILNAIISVSSFASWWGNLSKTERAGVIATGTLLTKDRYNKYRDKSDGIDEARYKKDMQDLEERLRKEYDEKLANQEPKKKKVNPNMPVIVEKDEMPTVSNGNKYLQPRNYSQEDLRKEELRKAEEVLKQNAEISPEEMEELKRLSEQAELNNKEQ